MVSIGTREIGAGTNCFVVAEAGVNHNGDSLRALALVDAAADAGADAVKFQTFRAEGVASASAPKAVYQLASTPAHESQLEMLRHLELDWDAHVSLKRRADERGVVFLSTPFDAASVDMLDRLGVEAFKVGSGDLTNRQLLEEVGAHGRPVLLSTGLADIEEVKRSLEVLRRVGCADIVVLHCVSEYPAQVEDVNLRAMATMRDRLKVPVGYSDHTEGCEVALAAVALGACVLEKHLTLDRSLPGPDQSASLEPGELRALVTAIRRVEASLGSGVKEPTAAERRTALTVRRSLAAAGDLAAGSVLTREMLVALRPGTGISPERIDELVGRRLARSVARNELLVPDDLE